jgi:hypothetical protein
MMVDETVETVNGPDRLVDDRSEWLVAKIVGAVCSDRGREAAESALE